MQTASSKTWWRLRTPACHYTEVRPVVYISDSLLFYFTINNKRFFHSGIDQYDRDSIINDFKNGACRLMVATSVAARGLDVKQLILVINYSCPNHYEDYIHRAGRTGRAGNKVSCFKPDQMIAFCVVLLATCTFIFILLVSDLPSRVTPTPSSQKSRPVMPVTSSKPWSFLALRFHLNWSNFGPHLKISRKR